MHFYCGLLTYKAYLAEITVYSRSGSPPFQYNFAKQALALSPSDSVAWTETHSNAACVRWNVAHRCPGLIPDEGLTTMLDILWCHLQVISFSALRYFQGVVYSMVRNDKWLPSKLWEVTVRPQGRSSLHAGGCRYIWNAKKRKKNICWVFFSDLSCFARWWCTYYSLLVTLTHLGKLVLVS